MDDVSLRPLRRTDFPMPASTGGVPLVQRSPVAAYQAYVDELAAVLPVPSGALSSDYRSGEPAARRGGPGAATIATVVADPWPAYPGARDVVVPVATGNRASWRALERAGFRRVAEGELEPDVPADPRDHLVCAVSRAGDVRP